MMQEMNSLKYQAEVVVVGAGLAGLVASIELLELDKKILLLERDNMSSLGGLAKQSFGGICLVDTPEQKRSGIKDSMDLALSDWLRYGEINQEGHAKCWAESYIENSMSIVYEWLKKRNISFLPVVNWPERGMNVKGNSVPRWHISWGTGFQIIKNTLSYLEAHPKRKNLTLCTEHKVENFIINSGAVVGVKGITTCGKTKSFEAYAESTALACGGVCGGDLSFLKKSWPKEQSPMPNNILNGSHRYADGALHKKAQDLGASLSNLDKNWHYAAGIHYPQNKSDVAQKGLSLVPPRSALWLNALGQRIGPSPLVGYTDTSYLVDSILKEPGQYSWQILNWKIAIRELAVSGCQYMSSFLKKSRTKLLWELLFGNKALVRHLIENSEDFVVADNLEELAQKMNHLTEKDGILVHKQDFLNSIRHYDSIVDSGSSNDFQLKKLLEFKKYRGDRLRIARSQKIEEKSSLPLIAIREFILTRKSLGGIVTNLSCEVLNDQGRAIPGLYAIGESSGFGGGGIHGKRSLEGTFLGSCVLTGYKFAHSL